MSELEKIPALVALNRIESALQILDAFADRNPVFKNDVLHLRNRWADFTTRRNRGELSYDDENRQHAKIVSALLDLTERMKRETGSVPFPATSPFQKYAPTLAYALGGLALVFVLLFAAKKLLRDEPFDFTVKLMPKPDIKLSPAHPPLDDAKLILHLANESKPAEIKPIGKHSGEFDSKNIAPNYRGHFVRVQLEDAAGLNRPVLWRLEQDSVRLDGKSQTLWIVLDNNLGLIRGSVQDAHNDAQPISGAIVETKGISGTTDSLGRYTLRIPLELQEAEYQVTARKSGYDAATGRVRPASPNPELHILMPRSHEN